MKREQWRVVVGFPAYQVSNCGRVRRATPGKGTSVGKILKFRFVKGYTCVSLSVRGKVFQMRINRLVCEAWHGPPPTSKHMAAHWDGNSQNNDPKNLRWATPAENNADMIRVGTSTRGERNASAKLTVKDVVAIKKLITDGFRLARIARDFNVSRVAIQDIAHGRTWAWLIQEQEF